jgi:hypothetical protein
MSIKKPQVNKKGSGPLRERRRTVSQRRRFHAPWLLAGVAVVLGVVVVLFKFGPLQASTNLPSDTEWPRVVEAATHIDEGVFSAVGTGDLPPPIKAMNSTQRLGGADGKPQVLYIGAEYCSTCAAQRWSLVAALSRFGTFTALPPTRSVSGESYPEFPTFTFYRSQYDSPYFNFVSVETGNRSKQQLQRPTQDQQSMLTLYDRQGTIPFINFGNKYYTVGSGYDMNVLADKSWFDVTNGLNDPQNRITKVLVGNSNYLTAAMCQLTQNLPTSVCESPAITAISAKLG